MILHRNHFMTKALLWYGVSAPDHRGKWRVLTALINLLDIRLEDGTYVEERMGAWWNLRPSDYVHRDVFWFGEKDRWALYHILRLLPPNPVILDVGANFGYYSVRLAKEYGLASRVFAFEPNPATHELLKKNIALNGLTTVEAVMAGLADHEGTAGMASRLGNSGASTVVEGSGIQLTTLDRFWERQTLERLDFIKIDVEGFEEKLLRGAAETLRRFLPLILIELSPPTLARTGSSVQRVLDLLDSYGYDVLEINRKELRPLGHLPEGETLINVFGVRKS